MALTDGSYIARLKLNRLDQVYLAGDTVPGSAFTDDAQVVKYIRRGWVDSVGASAGGGSVTPHKLLAHSSPLFSAPTVITNYADDYLPWAGPSYQDGTAVQLVDGETSPITIEIMEDGIYSVDILGGAEALGADTDPPGDGTTKVFCEIFLPGNDPDVAGMWGGESTVFYNLTPEYGTVIPAFGGGGVNFHPLHDNIFFEAGTKIRWLFSNGRKADVAVRFVLSISKIG